MYIKVRDLNIPLMLIPQQNVNLDLANQLGKNHGLRAFGRWTYAVADVSRSPYSIRLDYNKVERENRQKLVGEIIRYEREESRWGPRPAKIPGVGYKVWDESWYTTTNPPSVIVATDNAQ